MGHDDSIGSAGTTPVSPDNPLYDAVKSGGGYVEDEDGNVSGGPDGDGTARTKQERLNQSNNAMGDSSSSNSSSSSKNTKKEKIENNKSGGGSETNAQKRNRLIRQGGSSGGSDNSSSGRDVRPNYPTSSGSSGSESDYLYQYKDPFGTPSPAPSRDGGSSGGSNNIGIPGGPDRNGDGTPGGPANSGGSNNNNSGSNNGRDTRPNYPTPDPDPEPTPDRPDSRQTRPNYPTTTPDSQPDQSGESAYRPPVQWPGSDDGESMGLGGVTTGIIGAVIALILAVILGGS